MDQIGKRTRLWRVFAWSCAAWVAATAAADDRVEFSRSSKPVKDLETSSREDWRPGLFDNRGGGDQPGASLRGAPFSIPDSPSMSEKRSKELKKLLDRQQNWIFMNPDEFGEEEESEIFSGDDPLADFSETESMGLVERFLFEEGRSNNDRQLSMDDEEDSSSPFGFGRDAGHFDPSRDIFSSLDDQERNVSPVDQFLKANASGFGQEDSEDRLNSSRTGWDLIFNSNSKNDEEAGLVNGRKRENQRDGFSFEQSFNQRLFTTTGFLDPTDREDGRESASVLDGILNRGGATDRQAGLFGQSSPLNSAEDSTRRSFMPFTANQSMDESFQGIDFSSSGDTSSSPGQDIESRSGSFDFLNSSTSFGQSSLPSRRESQSEETTAVRSLFNTPTTFKIPKRDF